jgi:PncC family amidohydrolase
MNQIRPGLLVIKLPHGQRLPKTPGERTAYTAENINYFSCMITEASLITLSEDLGRRLHQSHLTCAVAESCTGGLIGAAITSIAGSSEWFGGGVIAYSNDIKMRLLGVPEQVLTRHGAVSAETVSAMAEGAARLMQTDCAIAVSGIAGPGGGTEEKPVGLIFIGIRVNGETKSFRYIFPGDRSTVRNQTAGTAISLLTTMLTAEQKPQTI